jgi:hypothetical protein
MESMFKILHVTCERTWYSHTTYDKFLREMEILGNKYIGFWSKGVTFTLVMHVSVFWHEKWVVYFSTFVQWQSHLTHKSFISRTVVINKETPWVSQYLVPENYDKWTFPRATLLAETKEQVTLSQIIIYHFSALESWDLTWQ